MFVLKKGNQYMRHLGGRLLDDGHFVVLGALWAEDLQEAKVFQVRHVSHTEDINIFLEQVRKRYGEDIAPVNIRFIELRHMTEPKIMQTINGWRLWENDFKSFPATKRYVTFHPIYDGHFWEQHDTMEEVIAFCTSERFQQWHEELL